MRSLPLPVACQALIGLTLLGMSVLLFAGLGHYALWDDEAATALAAKGVLRTGDTSVVLEHGNISAYRNGLDIRGFSDHSMPPLGTYLAALSFRLFGIDAWSARLPFALLGVATCALILFWARHESWLVLLVLGLGLLGNVSLILFFRQARYFGPSIFLTCAMALVYWRGESNPRQLLLLAALSVLLFLSNYLEYVAFYGCLAVDYLGWKRRAWPFSWSKCLLLFGPQLVLIGLAACVWNPFLTPHGAYATANGPGDRLILFFWYWCDLDQAEFFALPILLLAVMVGLIQRRPWLVRGGVAILVYITVIACISPQPVSITSMADIRYGTALIPLAIALEAGAICASLSRWPLLAVLAALVVFGTNLCNGGPFLNRGFRLTLFDYIGELIHPPPDPYTPAAQWINEHVPVGDSIWVLPDYATYPLMFHAPRALYAWQLDWPPRPDFASLPLIQFKGQEAPDYLIAFGPSLNEMARDIQSWNHPEVSYRQVATIDVFWKDLYRPELFWRTFKPVTNFDPSSQAIYIFRRTLPPITH